MTKEEKTDDVARARECLERALELVGSAKWTSVTYGLTGIGYSLLAVTKEVAKAAHQPPSPPSGGPR